MMNIFIVFGILAIVLIWVFFKLPKECPQCRRFLVKDVVEENKVLVCPNCGYLEVRNRKHRSKNAESKTV